MRTVLAVISFVVMILTQASATTGTITDAQYQKSRAVERVVNALQVLQNDHGYSETQKQQLASIQSDLYDLAIELFTDIDGNGISLEDHDKVRSFQRAQSIMFLTTDVTGFTPTQQAIIEGIRSQALAVAQEIHSQLDIQQ